ncbi:butyrophilin subfamily 3 member A2-like [Protopterus annectens]|uniref:butyrophilin subfamily 3 member A2-like n=1 Tax=Protopterus annectens TaxID=7888 RepID=UPI001CF998E6|nr:butyrophilin subfamily 3 member A2-like [Protopterus annectens]
MKPDKGGGFVFMDEYFYENKMLNHLQSDTYLKSSLNVVHAAYKKIRGVLDDLFLEDKFHVHGASGPVLSLLNEDVILPCRIIPEHKPENIEITWATADKNIHTFIEEEHSDKSHIDRTELFKEEFSHGNVSLKLKNVQVSDQAKYTCIVTSQLWYGAAIIELQVAAFGKTPVIHVFIPYEDGIKLICTSAAWYPKPKVLWIEEDGEDLENRAETSLKVYNYTGAYEIHSSVIVRSHSKSALSCIIQNTLLKQEKVSRVMLSGNNSIPRWNVSDAICFANVEQVH